MGEFLQKDRIPEFDSITEIDCLPAFTFAKQDGIIIMYHLLIDQKATNWLAVDTLRERTKKERERKFWQGLRLPFYSTTDQQ